MKRLCKALVIFLALLGIGIASAFAVVAILMHQETVRVPDVRGRDIVTALETVGRNGLSLKVERREPDATLPRDTIISQIPSPGEGLKKGRQVRVVVSLGPSGLAVPALTGLSSRKADLMVRQGGFVPGEVAHVFSDDVERDTVIAQDPPAGSPLEKGGTINLLVSDGKRPDRFLMPDLRGKGAEDAVGILDRLGLRHHLVTRSLATGEPGLGRVVIGQKPGAGSPVGTDTTVELVVRR